MKLGAWTLSLERNKPPPAPSEPPPQFTFMPGVSPLTDLFGLMYALAQNQTRTARLCTDLWRQLRLFGLVLLMLACLNLYYLYHLHDAAKTP